MIFYWVVYSGVLILPASTLLFYIFLENCLFHQSFKFWGIKFIHSFIIFNLYFICSYILLTSNVVYLYLLFFFSSSIFPKRYSFYVFSKNWFDPTDFFLIVSLFSTLLNSDFIIFSTLNSAVRTSFLVVSVMSFLVISKVTAFATEHQALLLSAKISMI